MGLSICIKIRSSFQCLDLFDAFHFMHCQYHSMPNLSKFRLAHSYLQNAQSDIKFYSLYQGQRDYVRIGNRPELIKILIILRFSDMDKILVNECRAYFYSTNVIAFFSNDEWYWY